MNVWRPLIEHAIEHVGAGKLISTEADSFWLPDTSGTDYRRNHVKTTIIIADIDAGAKHLGYFHNAGYHELGGEDFDRLFRVGVGVDPTFLPLYAEMVRVDRVVRRSADDLARIASERLAVHVARRPVSDPVARWGERFATELPRMSERGLDHYHAWAFATTRQFGASMELLSAHIAWLERAGEGSGFDGAAAAFHGASEGAKAFILKAARAVNARRPLDAGPIFAEMSSAWNRGMDVLARSLGVA